MHQSGFICGDVQDFIDSTQRAGEPLTSLPVQEQNLVGCLGWLEIFPATFLTHFDDRLFYFFILSHTESLDVEIKLKQTPQSTPQTFWNKLLKALVALYSANGRISFFAPSDTSADETGLFNGGFLLNVLSPQYNSIKLRRFRALAHDLNVISPVREVWCDGVW